MHSIRPVFLGYLFAINTIRNCLIFVLTKFINEISKLKEVGDKTGAESTQHFLGFHF